MFRTSKVVAAPAWRDILRVHCLDTVDGAYQSTDGHAVTRSGSTEVRRIALDREPDRTPAPIIYLKKYWVNRARQLWSGALRGGFFGRSKVRREFENLARLRRWGLDAPEPVAYGEERCGRFLVRSFLVSAGIPNPVPLDRYVRDCLGEKTRPDPTHRRRALIESLAEATRKLHAQCFVHHDYFWRNIILSEDSLEHFWLIDAHKGRVWSMFQETQSRATDLAALDAPSIPYFRRTERLRFFLRYCGRSHLDEPARKLLRAVLRRAEPMRSKQRQRVEQSRNEFERVPT